MSNISIVVDWLKLTAFYTKSLTTIVNIFLAQTQFIVFPQYTYTFIDLYMNATSILHININKLKKNTKSTFTAVLLLTNIHT